ncbi:methyltransferase [Nonomuraea phyllanthi]|uniref:Methyltransferase n=2 Tax=Nonomuraea phyllanthi TaxID=2219224 RepID=A0A5C4VJ98_9ACTN|nr:methyltransferase [Nonomuraea phyllanthi]
MTTMARSLLRRIASAVELDLRWTSARLDSMGAPESYISAIMRDDHHDKPSLRALLSLAGTAAERALDQPLRLLRERGAADSLFVWPGQHYRLLASIVELLKPQTVVEIGTFDGASALALLENLPVTGRLVTFDVVPWSQVGQTLLRAQDLDDGRLTPITGDLCRLEVFEAHAELLRTADLIFLDGPKDGEFEPCLMSRLGTVGIRPGTPLLFDDIRLWNMLEFWHTLDLPKLDVTGFGHFTGTGLALWEEGRI